MTESWKSQIPNCFRESDLAFANHPNDEERAFNLLVTLRAESVGWKEVKAAFEAFLMSERARPDHIERVLSQIERLYRPWLLD
jgi:hypothetical protein